MVRTEEEIISSIQEARLLLGQEKVALDASFKDKLYLAQVAASSNNSFGSSTHLESILKLQKEKIFQLVKKWIELTTGLLRDRYQVLTRQDGDVIFDFVKRLVDVELIAAQETTAKFFELEVLEEGLEKLATLKQECLIGAAIEIGKNIGAPKATA